MGILFSCFYKTKDKQPPIYVSNPLYWPSNCSIPTVKYDFQHENNNLITANHQQKNKSTNLNI